MNKFKFIAEEVLEPKPLLNKIQWTGNNGAEVFMFLMTLSTYKKSEIKADFTLTFSCIESYSFKTNELIEKEYVIHVGDTILFEENKIKILRAKTCDNCKYHKVCSLGPENCKTWRPLTKMDTEINITLQEIIDDAPFKL